MVLTLNEFGTQFVIPDQHALKVIIVTSQIYSRGSSDQYQSLSTSSQDALKQRMGITISRQARSVNPVVSYNLDYPYLVENKTAAGITNEYSDELKFYTSKDAPYFIGERGRRKMVYFLEGRLNTHDQIQQRFQGLASSQYQILSRQAYYQQLSQLDTPSNNEQLEQGIRNVDGITFANGRIQYASHIHQRENRYDPPNFQERPEAFFIPPGASSCTFRDGNIKILQLSIQMVQIIQ